MRGMETEHRIAQLMTPAHPRPLPAHAGGFPSREVAGVSCFGGALDPFAPTVDGLAHDPLDPPDLERVRAWLVRQPQSGRVSVYTALRLLATIYAERHDGEDAA